jgi:hypothetical protein
MPLTSRRAPGAIHFGSWSTRSQTTAGHFDSRAALHPNRHPRSEPESDLVGGLAGLQKQRRQKSRELDSSLKLGAQVVSAAQLRAGRGLLALTSSQLAELSGVGWATIKRFEDADGVPPSRGGTLERVVKVL